jgi:hypothetical protein
MMRRGIVVVELDQIEPAEDPGSGHRLALPQRAEEEIEKRVRVPPASLDNLAVLLDDPSTVLTVSMGGVLMHASFGGPSHQPRAPPGKLMILN